MTGVTSGERSTYTQNNTIQDDSEDKMNENNYGITNMLRDHSKSNTLLHNSAENPMNSDPLITGGNQDF